MSIEEAVFGILTELATALTSSPAALPLIEKRLADLRLSDSFGFSKGVCKVLLESSDHVIQHTAGLVLKQHLNTDDKSRSDEAVRKTLLIGLSHPTVRTVSSTCITTCLQSGPHTWPDLIPTVITLMRQSNYYEGSLQCLEHLIERFPDSGMGAQMLPLIPAILSKDEPSEGALNLLQGLFTLNTCGQSHANLSPEQRRQADELQETVLATQHEYVGTYLRYLIKYLGGGQPSKLACIAMRNIADTVMLWTSTTKELWTIILNSCIQYLGDSAGNIQSEHLELIRIFSVNTIRQASILDTCSDHFKKSLINGPLLTALLNGLLWSELALSTESGITNSNDGDQADPEYLPSDDQFNKDDDDEHEPDGDELTDSLLKKFKNDNNFGLRSQTQFCLSSLSTEFSEDLCQSLMETCGSRLQHENWKYREAAITLLGVCIPETAHELLRRELLQRIVSVLQKCIQSDPYALVRAAALWCVEQIGDGLLEYLSMFDDSDSDDDSEFQADPSGATAFIDTQCIPILQGSLLDPNKRCQRNAITGLAALASCSPVINCNASLHALIDCLPKYHLYNRCKVFSSVVTALSAPAPDKVTGIVEKIASHCDRIIQTGNNLVRTSELPYILAACAKGLLAEDNISQQLAVKLLEQATIVVRTVHAAVMSHHFWGLNSAVCALDVVSTIADTCPEVFTQQSIHIKDLLEVAVSLCSLESLAATASTAGDRRAIIDGCAALSGDLAVKNFSVIAPLVPSVIQFLSYQALYGLVEDQSYTRACVARSNVFWASSEVVHRANIEHIQPYLLGFAKTAVALMKEMTGRKGAKGFKSNLAGLLGKIAGRDATVLLNPECGFDGEMLLEWAMTTSAIDNCDEKHENVIGMGHLLRTTSDPSLWIIYGLILVTYIRSGMSPIPEPIRELIINLKSIVQSVPPPKVDSIYFVFEYFRAADFKSWTYESITNLSKASNTPTPDEQAWKYLCKMHGSSRYSGLRPTDVRSMYSQGMRHIEQDYVTAVKSMLHELS